MLDIKYYRDYRHNYLIIKDNGCMAKNIYQRKMVTENKIKGLLTSQERHINGDILLYYDITSRQSLLHIYEGRSIGMEQLRGLFMQLRSVDEVLQKYLLDVSCLILLPEFIFQNMETKEYFFLYYPDPEEGNISELMEFLIARVDNEDMEAVETVYKIADLIRREQFALDEVLGWFQEDTPGQIPDQQEDNLFPDENTEEIQEEWRENSRKKGLGGRFFDWIKGLMGRSTPEKRQEADGYMATFEDPVSRPEEDAGNTLFIPWTENCENKLYSMNQKYKKHIDLEKLPLTVGKLAGAVDMVIEEASISRMHAKFSRNGSRVYITDLNSTNGTFRNGMRLVPNASEPIEPGDEIRLGKLKFIYR